MANTHILVDFENVQPSAADITLVRGENLRLVIFRGPGQMKYAADVVEAWQPLGENVTFVRCAKAGRNASDMHIAFYLGELVAAHRTTGGTGTRFVIVSRDTDFDPLLLHIRGLGYEASRVASIGAALPSRGVESESKAGRSRATRTAASAPKPIAARSAARKSAVKKTATAKKAASALVTPAVASHKSDSPAAGADALAKIVQSLQRMGEKRPTKRKGLARHIESHLGRTLAPDQIEALMHRLERDGALVFNDGKVDYRLPRSKR